jgi:type II secretory pathway component PulJ
LTGDPNRPGSSNLQDLEQRLDIIEGKTLPLLTATIRRLLNANIDDLTELPETAETHHERFQEHAARLSALEAKLDRLGDIGNEQTTKDQKIAAVLAYADNKRDSDQATIAVSAREIKGCVGVSRRYAYDLVEDIAELDHCRLREAATVQTSTGTKRKAKAVLVDCEAVHSVKTDVKSFTTGGKQNGDSKMARQLQEDAE